MGNIDQIELGTASNIQVVTDLPTTNVENFQQGTLFKLPSGQVFRLTKPIFKATPLITDFELLVTSGKTPLSASDIIEVNGDTYFDTTGLVANTELLVICVADGRLDLDNTLVKNTRATDNFSTATHGAGTTFDPAKDYQVFNGDVAIDVDDIAAVGKVHVFECDTNDLVITFSNGTVQNKGSSPMFDTAGAFVNMRAGMVYTVTKIAANLVVVE